jgi:DNA-binding GntR family transcriptional regulator
MLTAMAGSRTPREATRSRLAPLQRASLPDRVYAALRDSILAGGFAPGEQLVEARLADELGVSRGPVRDALRRLVEDSLVVDRPHGGSFVREIDAGDLVEIYNVRSAIETLAARLCVRRAVDAGALREQVEVMRAAAARGDAAAVVAAEVAFHERLCELAGNTHLLRTFKRLEGPIHLALAMDDATYESLDDIAAEHLPLVDAIAARDERRAIAESHTHVMSSIGPLVARLGGDPDELVGPLG